MNFAVGQTNDFDYQIELDPGLIEKSVIVNYGNNGTSSGTISFCALVETTILDDKTLTTVNQRTNFNIDFDLTNNSFSGLGTNFVPKPVQDINHTMSNTFSIQGCVCSSSSFSCTTSESEMVVSQDEWLYVCLFPNATAVNITNFNLDLTNPAITDFSYNPVGFGSGEWRHDDLTIVDVGQVSNIDVVRSKVYLVARLFDSGEAVKISGNVFLSFKGSDSEKKLEFKPYEMLLPINRGDEEQKPECSGLIGKLLQLFF